jgi:hypothetical protein
VVLAALIVAYCVFGIHWLITHLEP